jgi:hypothetical protein
MLLLTTLSTNRFDSPVRTLLSAPAVRGKHQAEWITISTDEYDSMRRMIDVLSDKELMTQIREGKCQKTQSHDF